MVLGPAVAGSPIGTVKTCGLPSPAGGGFYGRLAFGRVAGLGKRLEEGRERGKMKTAFLEEKRQSKKLLNSDPRKKSFGPRSRETGSRASWRHLKEHYASRNQVREARQGQIMGRYEFSSC